MTRRAKTKKSTQQTKSLILTSYISPSILSRELEPTWRRPCDCVPVGSMRWVAMFFSHFHSLYFRHQLGLRGFAHNNLSTDKLHHEVFEYQLFFFQLIRKNHPTQNIVLNQELLTALTTNRVNPARYSLWDGEWTRTALHQR